MAVQQNKVTRSKRDKRAHARFTVESHLATDPTSGERHRRHHVTADGFYKGKKVLDIGDD